MDLSNWLRILIIGISWFISLRFSYFAATRKSWVLGSYSLTLLAAGIHHLMLVLITVDEISYNISLLENISGWSAIVSISVLYCGLAHLIRANKPKVARFPRIFTALPLLIIVSYPFAHNNQVIDQWLFQIYEGGAILVAIMIYGYQSIKFTRSYYYNVLIGIGLAIISYVIYWFFNDIQLIRDWAWKTSFAGALILIYSGYVRAIK